MCATVELGNFIINTNSKAIENKVSQLSLL